MMDLIASALLGCYEIRPSVSEDVRGRFVKVFHAPSFASRGLETQFPEEYYTVSKEGVARGMHFQLPPHEHVKLIYVVQGAVMDVVLDLRAGSPSFGQAAIFELSAAAANMVYVPRGFAHGFFVRSGTATMIYRVSTVYAPEHDAGVLWSSVNVPWPDRNPLLSERDRGFPVLQRFNSPFRYA